jgi:hypothetical protein
MPPRRPKETLEEVRERLTREQRQRTAARIGELVVDTLQNTALEEVRERLTREQRQRTAARIGELAVETLQNTATDRLSELAVETYLNAARKRRHLGLLRTCEVDDEGSCSDPLRQKAFAKPPEYESASLVLLCLLLWVLVANALLVQYIHLNRR